MADLLRALRLTRSEADPLDAIYPVPRGWMLTEGGCRRFFHTDLLNLSAAELDRQRRRLAMRLLFDDLPDPWLLDRAARIDAHLKAREVRRG